MTAQYLAAGADLYHARMQMALSLGWHIVIACFGVGFPTLVLFAEWRAHRRGDDVLRSLAHTWAKAMGVLFATGAVSGTILSFEMGMLWPGLMSTYGAVYGFPFTLEGFAFFVEAIFVGVYLYGWDRLSPRAHMLAALPMIAAGVAGAFFVVAANSWMQTPAGFRLVGGRLTDPDPWAALFNPSAFSHAVHMIVAAFMVTGFSVASVYAVGMLRGRRDRYHRYGLLIPLTAAAIAAPVQIGVGDWIAAAVAEHQPGKLAALEALATTRAGAPLSIGGIYAGGHLRYAVELPRGLSLLARHDPDATITGLDQVPAALQPPVTVTHLSYDTMVGIGFGLLALGAWFAVAWWRRRDLPRSRWFLRAVAVSGVAAVTAMEAGWIAAEVGRQPWIVYGLLLTKDAVSTAPGLRYGFYAVAAIYTVLTVLTVYVLRRLAHSHATAAPQEETELAGVGA